MSKCTTDSFKSITDWLKATSASPQQPNLAEFLVRANGSTSQGYAGIDLAFSKPRTPTGPVANELLAPTKLTGNGKPTHKPPRINPTEPVSVDMAITLERMVTALAAVQLVFKLVNGSKRIVVIKELDCMATGTVMDLIGTGNDSFTWRIRISIPFLTNLPNRA